MAEENYNKESGFDQKAFLQIRLHENLSKLDELNFHLALVKPAQQLEIYGCQFNILSSVLSTIHSKLKLKEKEQSNEKRVEISNLIVNAPKPFWGLNSKGVKVLFFNIPSNLSEKLTEFRFLLEDLMDKHGFNPSKENVGVSIARQ